MGTILEKKLLNLKKIISNNHRCILIGIIILYIIIIFGSLIIKYNNFEYTGMDLAIFNQVFFNSSQGNLFHFTIHPHSYLGDHFTPFLILLLPFYYLFRSPLTLIFLQTLIIALTAIPIYLLAKHNLNKNWALFLSFLWLINPLAINMNFFEFHLLPFAVFLLLFAIYFYQKKNLNLFIIFCLLSLSVREDVFLVVLMFGILALFQKRKIKWISLPIILAIAWFALAQMIIAPHNPLGAYKFIPYYNWLGGNSMLAIAINYLTHPLEIIKHFFLLPNIAMFLSLLMPFIFIPLLKPKYLLLSFLIFLQYALTNHGGGDIIYKTHYAALFLPGIITSFIMGIKLIYKKGGDKSTESKFIQILQKNKTIIIVIILLSHFYLLATATPLQIISSSESHSSNSLTKQKLLNYIPPAKAVATSYEFLASLSTRPKIYSLNYAWRGYKELSYDSYKIPQDLKYIYVNFEDALKYELQYTQNDPQKKYENSYLNWQKLFNEYNLSLQKIIDTYSVWEYNPESGHQETDNLYRIIPLDELNIQNKQKVIINNEIEFLGWDKNNLTNSNKLDDTELELLPLSLYFQKYTENNINDNYQLQLSIGDYNKIYPLTYGFYPTSKWQKREIIKINYWFLIPPELKNTSEYQINLVNLQGGLTLDKKLSIVKNYRKIDILKPDLDIVW